MNSKLLNILWKSLWSQIIWYQLCVAGLFTDITITVEMYIQLRHLLVKAYMSDFRFMYPSIIMHLLSDVDALWDKAVNTSGGCFTKILSQT